MPINSHRDNSYITPNLENLENRELYSSTPMISEFMASNDKTIDDQDGASSDWIEIFNPTNGTINLNGYYLTDDSNDKTMWQFPSTIMQPGDRVVVFASDKNRSVSGSELHTNFKLSKSLNYLALVNPDGITVESVYDNFNGDQLTDVSYGTTESTQKISHVLIDDGDSARFHVPTNGSIDNVWKNTNFNDNSWTQGATGIGYEASGAGTYDPYLGGNETGDHVLGVYIRQEFNITDASEFTELELQIRYDDGFVAYLNGSPILSVNAQDGFNSTYASRAQNDHNDGAALQFTPFNLNDFIHLLNNGNNVLAIHGLNTSTNSSDMLFTPRLVAQTEVATEIAVGFMTEATPGAENIATGPILSNLTENPPQPNENESINITVNAVANGNAIVNVKMHYRVGYGSHVTLNMVDDGNGSDTVAGDGIYSATIPSSAYTSGDMVRWYVTSEDTSGRESRGPLFNDNFGTSQSAEYFGTVIADSSIDTTLPVFQWFTQNENASHNRGGTRASVFYDGRFYDNLFVRQRGGFTNAAVSQKFNFNKGEKFFVNDHIGWVDQINLNGHGVDSSYIKQQLAFETNVAAGQLSPESFNLYMSVNGQFDRVGNFVENVDEIFIDRNGLDKDGDVYKFVQKGRAGIDHPGLTFDNGDGIERKTGNIFDLSNMEALTLGLELNSLEARTNYIFDNLNIANLINYVAVHALIGDADDTRKNFYMYHDSQGSGEWYMIPWDKDFTFGFAGDAGPDYGNPFHADRAHNKPNASQWNQMFEVLFNTPETRAMYLRRLQTLADEMLGTNPGFFENRIEEIYNEIKNHPGTSLSAKNQLLNYFPNKRTGSSWGLFSVYSDPTRTDGAILPGSQSAGAGLTIGTIEYNPNSNNQDQEYIQILNNGSDAIDISGWKVSGAINYTFESGTVVLPGSAIYITPKAEAFRSRSTGPSGGQQLFVQGGYSGHLSNFGETVTIHRADETFVTTKTYTGDPSPAQLHLKITELNYNPTDPTTAEITAGYVDANMFEFIEIFNDSASETIDLAGVKLSDDSGVIFTFGSSTLGPMERILVVSNQAAFEMRYGSGLNVAGQFIAETKLSNTSENIKFDDASNSTIISFEYKNGDKNSWPSRANGNGSTLQIIDTTGDYDSSDNWQSSRTYLGTPGRARVANTSPIMINEVLTHTDAPREDQIELYNPTNAPIDISGWYLTDSNSNYMKYRIPNGTLVPANGYIFFNETDFNFNNTATGFNPDAEGFGLNGAHGDELWLVSDDGFEGSLLFTNHVEFDAAFNIASPTGLGTTLGRLPGVDTGEKLVHLAADTIGTDNASHKVSDVIISEVMYQPTSNDGHLEYIEIYNQTDATINLEGWRIDNAVSYTFPTNTILNADSVLLLVSFDPTDASLLNAFKVEYTVPAGVQILGPFNGSLSNGGERVQLERPDSPPTDEPLYTPYITADEVDYNNVAPWPISAAGGGDSLSRKFSNSYGDISDSWIGSTPTPGVKNTTIVTPIPGDVNGDGSVNEEDLNLVKSGFGAAFSLADLFNVRNNMLASQVEMAQAVIIPDAKPQALPLVISTDVVEVKTEKSGAGVVIVNQIVESNVSNDNIAGPMTDLGMTELTTTRLTQLTTTDETEQIVNRTQQTDAIQIILEDEDFDLLSMI